MRKNSVLLLACLFSLLSPRLFADIAAIHANALPQETAVLSALDDAKQLEPYSRSWTMNWDYPVAKDEVAARLSKDLGFLTLASKRHPENAELLLLTGLVADYAYNVDVDGSYDAAMNALGQAEKLAPADFRAGWFRATLECQTTQPKAGGDEFLSIEAGHAWDQLPVAFWDDYIECAYITNMPAHLLRAADHLQKLGAPVSERRNAIVDLAHKRFAPFDPEKDYKPEEVWQAENMRRRYGIYQHTVRGAPSRERQLAGRPAGFRQRIVRGPFHHGPLPGHNAPHASQRHVACPAAKGGRDPRSLRQEIPDPGLL